ncbi:hypothetical protein B0H10DRAFT_1965590 [Mycena sp. CBHHK59/15]|nr:hypothetical protein B0H10DRAFT_1965590 [Mycena sp. CBHHK59/15]
MAMLVVHLSNRWPLPSWQQVEALYMSGCSSPVAQSAPIICPTWRMKDIITVRESEEQEEEEEEEDLSEHRHQVTGGPHLTWWQALPLLIVGASCMLWSRSWQTCNTIWQGIRWAVEKTLDLGGQPKLPLGSSIQTDVSSPGSPSSGLGVSPALRSFCYDLHCLRSTLSSSSQQLLTVRHTPMPIALRLVGSPLSETQADSAAVHTLATNVLPHAVVL